MVEIKKTKQRKYREFKEYVLEKLRNPEYALMYLNESFHDEEDPQDFLTSLREIFEARGRDISSVAQETKLSRQNLYRILSEDGNPTLASVRTLLHVLGFELAVQPYRNGAAVKKASRKRKSTQTNKLKKIKQIPVLQKEPSTGKSIHAKKKK